MPALLFCEKHLNFRIKSLIIKNRADLKIRRTVLFCFEKIFLFVCGQRDSIITASIVWTHKLWRSKRQSSIFHAGEKETLLFSSADFMLKIMRLNLFMNVVSFSGSH